MIIALFAVDDLGGMGFDGSLPWPRNKEDMQWFKTTTENQIVVMGRNTWNSKDMPIPLPNRINVLITNNFIDNEQIIQLKGNIPESLVQIQDKFPNLNLFVIGGPNILMQSIPVLDYAFVTRITGEYHCDVKIDINNFLKHFRLKNSQQLETCKIEEYETIS